jgi:hypothetical protein
MTSSHLFAAPSPVGIFSRVKGGLTVYRGQDGRRYLFIVTSNSYKDRENETITTKALKHYVDSAWAVEDKCLPRNPLLFWHEKSAAIGDIVWCDMEGPFLLEVARERKNKAIRIQLDSGDTWNTTVKAIWDAIENVKVRWGASHGFEHPESARTDDGVYKYIRKFETSVLPLDAAANPYTFATTIGDGMDKDKFINDLLKIPGLAQKFRKGTRAVGQELRKQGLEHKALTEKGLLEDARALVEKIAAKFSDGVTPEEVDEATQMLVTGLASIAPASEPVEEPVLTEETMADETVPVEEVTTSDEEDEEKAAMYAKQIKLFERLIKSQEAITTDHTTMSDAMVKMAKALEPLADVPASVKALETRLTAIEKRFGGAPRQASRSEETVVDDKELTKHAKSQTERYEKLFPGLNVELKPLSGNGKE